MKMNPNIALLFLLNILLINCIFDREITDPVVL